MAYFKPAYAAPAARIELKPHKPARQSIPFVRYSGGGFDEGGMTLALSRQAIEEGALPPGGFLALSPEDQIAAFYVWAQRACGMKRNALEADPDTRTVLWQHYAPARQRGVPGRRDHPPPNRHGLHPHQHGDEGQPPALAGRPA